MIDIVITYVNYNDNNWQLDFKKNYNGQTNLCRFNRLNLLPYVIKSIYKFVKFDLGKIYIVVSHKSEIEQYINENIIAIEHKDIIPNEYLPLFNSSSIELFIHNIPNLSEQFIYFNDDMLLIKDLNKLDFYNNNIPYIFVNKYYKNHNMFSDFDIMIKNIEHLIFNKDIVNQDTLLYLDHGPSPMLKSIWKEIFNKYHEEIYSTITKFRESKNICQAIYHYYIIKLYGENIPKLHNKYILVTNNILSNTNEIVKTLYYDNKFGYIVINYTEDSHIQNINPIKTQIYQILDKYYDI